LQQGPAHGRPADAPQLGGATIATTGKSFALRLG
jgi:hypothetical protein